MRAPRGSLGLGSKVANPTEYARLYQRLRRADANYARQEREKGFARWRALWLAAVDYYSHGLNCCAWCGSKENLVIDHVNEDGTERRKPQRDGGHGNGHAFVAWLAANDYPDGFQVLCNSHNLRKYYAAIKDACESEAQ